MWMKLLWLAVITLYCGLQSLVAEFGLSTGDVKSGQRLRLSVYSEKHVNANTPEDCVLEYHQATSTT